MGQTDDLIAFITAYVNKHGALRLSADDIQNTIGIKKQLLLAIDHRREEFVLDLTQLTLPPSVN